MGGEGRSLEHAPQYRGCRECAAPQAAGRASLGALRRVVLKFQTFEWGARPAVSAVASSPWNRRWARAGLSPPRPCCWQGARSPWAWLSFFFQG